MTARDRASWRHATGHHDGMWQGIMTAWDRASWWHWTGHHDVTWGCTCIIKTGLCRHQSRADRNFSEFWGLSFLHQTSKTFELRWGKTRNLTSYFANVTVIYRTILQMKNFSQRSVSFDFRFEKEKILSSFVTEKDIEAKFISIFVFEKDRRSNISQALSPNNSRGRESNKLFTTRISRKSCQGILVLR